MQVFVINFVVGGLRIWLFQLGDVQWFKEINLWWFCDKLKIWNIFQIYHPFLPSAK